MTHRFTLATLLACTALLCTTAALAAQRVVLFEEITSQTCPPCADTNPYVEAMLADYPTQVAAVKWHVWWPAPGDDWFYLLQKPTIDWRIGDAGSVPPYGFYQGAAAPSYYIDGGGERIEADNSFSNIRAEIDGRLATPSPLTLSGPAEIDVANNRAEISVDMNVETPVAGTANRLFAALTEEHVVTHAFPTGTLTSGSPVVTGLSSTAELLAGMEMLGLNDLDPGPAFNTGLAAAGVRIKTIDSPTQVTLWANATRSGAQSFECRSLNNETDHHDVFRRVNNDADATQTGVPVTLTTLGLQHFDFTIPLNTAWDPEELHVVVWVQNMAGVGSGEVYQAREVVPTVNAVGVGNPAGPMLAQLGQNYPNPFRRSGTSIPFSLQRSGEVSLAIYSVSGRLVRQLVSGGQAAGAHVARWDGRDAAGQEVGSGIYYYRLETAGVEMARRMVILN
jgi:flagellar hook capping protein FlgD